MYFIGIDIGSTSTKVAVLDADKNEFIDLFLRPTGFSGVNVADEIYEILNQKDYIPNFITATGYGRGKCEIRKFHNN